MGMIDGSGLALGFTLLLALAALAALYAGRGVPAAWLERRIARRLAGHVDSRRVLAGALTQARAAGNRALFERLAANYRFHDAAVRALDPAESTTDPALLNFDATPAARPETRPALAA